MKIINLNEYKHEVIERPIVAMIGAFDGFHLGHQALMNKTLEIAKEKHLESAIITFNPNPKHYVKQKRHPILITMNEKIHYAENAGFDYFIIIDFSYQFRSLTAKQFVNEYLLGNSVEQLVCGFDFHYGRGKEHIGSQIEQDSDEKIKVHSVYSIDYLGKKVSSTRIHELLNQGNVEQCRLLLNRPYAIKGRVIDGNKIGRTLGYPTANIELSANYRLPKSGVYGVHVILDNIVYHGICNIGVKPTISSDNKMTVEVFLFDFTEDIYTCSLKIEFFTFIRNEQKFDNIHILKQQIQRDIAFYKSIME